MLFTNLSTISKFSQGGFHISSTASHEEYILYSTIMGSWNSFKENDNCLKMDVDKRGKWAVFNSQILQACVYAIYKTQTFHVLCKLLTCSVTQQQVGLHN